MSYAKIEKIIPNDDFILHAFFDNNDEKLYDCKPLFKYEVFKPLNNEFFFKTAKVSPGGYGIYWSDEIDLAESEIWINGKSPNTTTA